MDMIREYNILETIDDTEDSAIFRAKKNGAAHSVIIKLLKTEYPSLSKIERFKREYDLIQRITFNGVVKVHELIEFSGTFALVLEDFQGVHLGDVLLNRKETLKTFLELAISLSETLGNLHKENIVHMDIKPRNILVNLKKNIVKITDFGISSIIEDTESDISGRTLEGGTPAYMSPEQTGRMNRNVDYRTDLYSLGVMFYEVLTGSLPFTSDDPMEIVHAHIAVPPLPPNALNPDIPQPVSDIILKLMAKTAEERYQNSFGLMADLKTCYDHLVDTGEIPPFLLGEKDISLKFNISQKIYGRDREIAALNAAFDRCAGGSVELLLVSGYSGIGKSALINEVHKPIVARRGLFGPGKYEQFNRDVPYSAVIHAFQGVIRYLLAEKKGIIDMWQMDIQKAVGGNGKLIIDIIPDLELIIGPQPDVPELGPSESRNRFDHVFNGFVKVFAREHHPMVLFLDDLQWADLASLQLLKKLMLDPELKHMLLIGSYRNNEMDDTHPSMLTIKEITNSGVACTSLTLHPLIKDDVTHLVKDLLKCPMDQASNLAGILLTKTGGNPFFINQFMKTLYEDNIIEPVPSGWQWDEERIRAMQLTDNVVDLLAKKITRLKERSGEILKTCACIGNRFDLETLSTVLSRPMGEILPDLMALVEEGYLSPIKNAYTFHHDKIREAAYSLIPEDRQKDLHYKIGNLALENNSEAELEKNVFYILSHLNPCIDIMPQEKERETLIRLNLRAGVKARTSAAYSPALRYLETGISLLSSDSWEKDYDLTRDFYVNAAESACLSGDFTKVNQLCAAAKQYVTDMLDLSRFSEIEIISYISQNRLGEAVLTGREILKKLHVSIPENPTRLHVIYYLLKVGITLKGKKIEELRGLPEMTDPHIIQAMRILIRISISAFQYNSNILAIIAIKGILLSLKYGNSPSSASFYSGYAVILCGVFHKFDTGYKLSKMSGDLMERFNESHNKPDILMATGFIRIWKHHYRDVMPFLLEGYKIGRETGNFEMAATCIFMYTSISYAANKNLNEYELEMKKYLKALKQMNQQTPSNYMSIDMQSIRNFMGKSQDPSRLKGRYYDIDGMIPVHKAANDGSAIVYAYNHSLMLCYHFGDYENAVRYAELQKKYLIYVSGSSPVPRYYFYFSLALLMVFEKSGKIKQRFYLEKIRKNQKYLKRFSQTCPENFLPMYTLVEAERLRVSGDFIRAARYYEEAVRLSKNHGFILIEALSYELASRFYLSAEMNRIAGSYMCESRYAYSRYGAAGKVAMLEEIYADLMSQVVPGNTAQDTRTVRITDSHGTGKTHKLDLSSILKASRAISSEIVLGKLLEKIMWIAIENAGARKGVMIFEHHGGYVVEVEGGTEKKSIKTLQSVPIESYSDMSSSIVSYVIRSKKTLILDDAASDANFVNDPYILEKKPKSVLCAPIFSHGKLVGIIYLENNLSIGAFTPERLELLGILASQAVISIENARLYANLESKVRERTAELLQARDALWGEMKLARKIQTTLLPESPSIKGFDISAHMTPADEVGGDYYDIINVGKRDWVIIGDVSGHGVSAGLIMMMVQTAIKSVLNENPDINPAKLLTAINKTISDNIRKLDEDKYMTITALTYADNGKFYFSGLHQDILIYRAAMNDVETVETQGIWVGVVDNISDLITDETLTLNIGDTMLMFTDGITEALKKDATGHDNGQKRTAFGIHRLKNILKMCGRDSAERVKNDILSALEPYDCDDDVTMVVIKKTG